MTAQSLPLTSVSQIHHEAGTRVGLIQICSFLVAFTCHMQVTNLILTSFLSFYSSAPAFTLQHLQVATATHSSARPHIAMRPLVAFKNFHM